MKTYLNILLLSFFSSITYSQTTAIPDPNFEAALIEFGIDDIADGSVLTANIDTVGSLFIGDRDINDLTGIEGFIRLKRLHSNINNLTTIDLSANTMLKYLIIEDNNLISIDLGGLDSLRVLIIRNNDLTELEIDGAELKILFCGNNNLTTLDLNLFESMIKLECEDNHFENLDLFSLTNLNLINCDGNPISELDLSNNSLLNTIIASNCENLGIIDMSGFLVEGILNENLLIANSPKLTCVEVSNPSYANDTFTNKDDHTLFSSTCGLAIEDNNEIEEINIYPNPATMSLTIQIIDENANYKIVETTGRLVGGGKLTQGLNTINLTSIPTGMYFIEIDNSTTNTIRRVIIK